MRKFRQKTQNQTNLRLDCRQSGFPTDSIRQAMTNRTARSEPRPPHVPVQRADEGCPGAPAYHRKTASTTKDSKAPNIVYNGRISSQSDMSSVTK